MDIYKHMIQYCVGIFILDLLILLILSIAKDQWTLLIYFLQIVLETMIKSYLNIFDYLIMYSDNVRLL